MQRLRRWFWLVCVLTTAAAAESGATELRYNYFDAEFVGSDHEGGEFENAEGFGLSASAPLSDSEFAYLRYSRLDFAGPDFTRYRIGLGWHGRLWPQTDVYLVLARERREREPDRADGYGAELGLRGAWGRQWEWSGGVGHVELRGAPNDTRLQLQLLFEMRPGLQLSAAFLSQEQFDEFRFGLRFSRAPGW